MIKRHKCTCVGLSTFPIFFVAMVVTNDIKLMGYFNIITNLFLHMSKHVF